jgi:hypothetical protein
MSGTPPVLVVCSHNQFMIQKSHNSRTSSSCGNPVTQNTAIFAVAWVRTYCLGHVVVVVVVVVVVIIIVCPKEG